MKMHSASATKDPSSNAIVGDGGGEKQGDHQAQRQQAHQQTRVSVPFLQSVRVNKDYSRAPEVHAHFGQRGGKAVYDAAAADIWGLGVLLFFLLIGKKPVSPDFGACT